MLKIGDEFKQLLKEELKRNIITIGLSSQTTVNIPSSWVWYKIPYNTEYSKLGDKLTLSNKKVIVGAGVNYILVSSNINYRCSTNAEVDFSIMKNNSLISVARYTNTINLDNKWLGITLARVLVPVTEGDIIEVGYQCGGTSDVMFSVGNSLTVEVVE